MSVYAIGDVQGCHAALLRLLEKLCFAPASDQLWFAGDLVNRGPESLHALRFVRSLGERAVCVLGNHDLHLLARAAGGRVGRLDTLDALLAAPDRDELLHWLRHRPLMHEAGGWVLAHAGIAPAWTLTDARAAARSAEAVLQADAHSVFLAAMYGDEPRQWSPELQGIEALRYTINAFTRMRYCGGDGALEFRAKGAPGTQAADLQPWFALAARKPVDAEIVFGHWSTLGRVHWPAHRVWGLDTGAVWGGRLTALNLETRELASVECPEYRRPEGAAED
ncbi:MAG: symmetrical bis(5'-nucleosyl)-tetraphosphatase [Pseudomonadota bacterium]